MEIKEPYSLLITYLITCKKNEKLKLWAYRAFACTTFLVLQIPLVSMGFSSLLISAIGNQIKNGQQAL
jgi:hypothetical protein